jgi:hypothetical protein
VDSNGDAPGGYCVTPSSSGWFGGSWFPYYYTQTCPTNMVLIGMQYGAPWYINGFGGVCAPYTIQGNGNIQIHWWSPYYLGVAGPSWGRSGTLMCPAGAALTGLTGQTGWAVDLLGLTCKYPQNFGGYYESWSTNWVGWGYGYQIGGGGNVRNCPWGTWGRGLTINTDWGNYGGVSLNCATIGP